MKLTPADRSAMLERYRAGEMPGALAREYGITPANFHQVRVRAKVPARKVSSKELRRLENLCGGALLPVYPVRLVSRPGSVCRLNDSQNLEGEAVYWTCRRCGKANPDEFIFCPACLIDRPGYSTAKGGDDGPS